MSSAFDTVPDPDDAAAAWLMAHDRGLSETEAREFGDWLGASPANRDAWTHAEIVWGAFDDEPDALLLSMRESALSARRPVFRAAYRWGAVAAAIALTVGATSWLTLRPPGGASDAQSVASATRLYSADVTRREVALEDGSRVTLDAHSRIAVRETAGRRDVALESGQAFFKVAHDASRPFVVAFGGRTVTATGTAFAVSKDGAKVSVILQEGKVRVEVPERSVETVNLTPGEQYSASGSGTASVRTVDVEDALAWRDGFLSFHNVTVREALSRMDRSRPPRVIVGDTAVGDLRVSGRFRADDPVAFVESLNVMYAVRVVHLPSGQLKILSGQAAGFRRKGSGE